MNDKIEIFCRRCGRYFFQSANTHLYKKTQCPCYSGQEKTPTDYFDLAREFAEVRLGRLLSKEYINSKTPLEWQCAKGHIWKNTFSNMKSQNQWCPVCSTVTRGLKRRKKQADVVDQLRAVHGEKYVYDRVIYRGIGEKIDLYCTTCGKYFSITARTALLGSGCQKCAVVATGDKNRKYSMTDLQCVAAKYCGNVISTEFHSVSEAIRWQCSKGHVFEKSLHQIATKHTWCDVCNVSFKKGEKIVRLYIEELFGKPFPSLRPKWLKHKNGYPLELDGFNVELGIAFEHQGGQHYEFIPHFHRRKIKFAELQQADRFKKHLCSEHGVVLIEVPELFSRLQPVDLETFLRNEIEKNRLEGLVVTWPDIELILRDYFTNYDYLPYVEAKAILKPFGFSRKKDYRIAYESGLLPSNLPRDPLEHYRKTIEWMGWADFLGESYVGDKSDIIWDYARAHEFVLKLKLNSQTEWKDYLSKNSLPIQIPVSPETLYKRRGDWISWKSWLGYEHQPKNLKRSVVQYDKAGNRISTFESAQAASKKTGVNFSKISACCRMKRPHADGIQWRFADAGLEKLEPLTKIISKNKAVEMYAINNEFVKSFPNVIIAAKDMGVSPGAIRMCCNGTTKKSAGYIWKYKNLSSS